MTYSFKTQYHPYCPVDWNNLTSIQNCWLGDTTVPLPDVNTQDPTVASTYGSWIQNLVQEYGIDGLRIDGAFISPVSLLRLMKILSLAAKCVWHHFTPLCTPDHLSHRHVQASFWTSFCESAGVFCMGEVFGSDIRFVRCHLRQTNDPRGTAFLA